MAHGTSAFNILPMCMMRLLFPSQAEPPEARSRSARPSVNLDLNLTVFVEWVRSMIASSFREYVNKVVEDFCAAADQKVEQLPVNMAKFALNALS